ncbi:MAG: phycobilisome rod-core linker polypeptide [Cyanobacteria bacterium P01_F01_bin.53]
MAIPLLEYAPLSQNQRVNGFEVPGDEQPRIFDTENLLLPSDMDLLIKAAYHQIHHEQQMLEHHRERFLESQLRANQITVRDFIRGLVLSDSFRRLTYECNNNYRFVELCVQRVLGRNLYDEREKLAWSIVLATKGLQGFVNTLLDGEEYLSNFGDTIVPYQRRRILPQREQGEVTFEHMARYGTDYRDQLPEPIYVEPIVYYTLKGSSDLDYLRWDWQKTAPQSLKSLWVGVFLSGLGGIVLLILAIFLGL